MSYFPRIFCHQLSYALPHDKAIFTHLNLSISSHRIGLVGRNGIGKSTLLRLFAGELLATNGSIEISGKVAYLPQNSLIPINQTVADFLGFAAKLSAYERIVAGSCDIADFDALQDDWLFQDRINSQLANFKLEHIKLGRRATEFFPYYLPSPLPPPQVAEVSFFKSLLTSLSGGEFSKLQLLKLFFSDSDILLLDEPSNHLDQSARQILYQQIQQREGLILIASHDRELLQYMDQIIELTSLGCKTYGGNYQFYQEQCALDRAAKLQQASDAKKYLQLTQHSVQTSRERREQRQAKGIKERRLGKIDKMGANSKRGRSERTQSRLVTQRERLLITASAQLQQAKSELEVMETIQLNLPNTYLPNQKLALTIENLSFHYPDSTELLINHFNLIITGPERIALLGDNGTGKSTLVKLILGELQPTQGKIELGVTKINYLDQHCALLKPELSVIANFQYFNPNLNEEAARFALAQFLFKNIAAEKLVKDLSGGEKLRAALACILLSDDAPQLLILDEPTNHLDLASIQALESALNCYLGAMIVISHDSAFLRAMGIEKNLRAPFI